MSDDTQGWDEAAQRIVDAARERKLASERWERANERLDEAITNARAMDLPTAIAQQKAAEAVSAGELEPEVVIEIGTKLARAS